MMACGAMSTSQQHIIEPIRPQYVRVQHSSTTFEYEISIGTMQTNQSPFFIVYTIHSLVDYEVLCGANSPD